MRSLKDERPHVMRRSSERSMDISGLSLGKNVECHVLHVAKSSPTTRHVLAIGTVHNESAVSDTRDTLVVPQLTGTPVR